MLGDTLFKRNKMNDIVKTFVLAGDKFIPEMHLKYSEFMYSVYRLKTNTE